MALRILIADDHGLVRAGLRSLLNSEPDLDVVGEASTGDETLRLATELGPDLVLLDISMPGANTPGATGNGIQTAARLREVAPATRVLILTMHEDKGLLREAVRAGASGYILKRAVEADLLTAIHSVSRGDLYIHPSMVRGSLRTRPLPWRANPTRRSFRPARSPSCGWSCKGTRTIKWPTNLRSASVLFESHRANLMGKLNVRSRVELVRYARTRGLLE